MQAKLIATALTGTMALTGCAVTVGENAQSAAECKGAYDQRRLDFERSQIGNTGPGSGAGKAIARGMLEAAYNDCLARVGAGGYTAPRTTTTTQTTAPTRTVTKQQTRTNRALVRDGRLALPTQYPLLDGDAQLWAQMSREQQERALLFLQDGGTIRASLQPD